MDEWGKDYEQLDPLGITNIFEYTGAVWRDLTPEETSDLALFYAEDYITEKAQLYGDKLDVTSYWIAVINEKGKVLRDEMYLARVMDYVNFDVQVFYTFSPMMLAGEASGRIRVIDNMSKVVRAKGVFRFLKNEGDALFTI